jgi:flagellar protein FlaG
MTIQHVGNTAPAVALNLPGRAAPQGAEGSAQAVHTPLVSEPPAKSAPSSLEQVQQAMRLVAEQVQAKANSLEFSIDKSTGTTVVKIVDTQTRQVIRQIPSQEIIDIAQSIESQQGLLLKQKA